MAEAPPPYTTYTTPPTGATYKIPFIPETPHHRFPREFGIYKAPGSFSSNMVIARMAHDPNPLFYISTHGALSSKPSVCLHSGRNESFPPLATADFHAFSSSTDISLLPANSQPGPPVKRTLQLDGIFSAVFFFVLALPGGQGGPERFEWKNSAGAEVRGLRGRSHGRKLVRVRTGEVVVAWAPPGMSNSKWGKMSFLGEREVLGEEFELMAVITMLALMEKGRRKSNSGAAAGAGGGGS